MPAPAGYTTVSARNLKDASNTKIDNATIHFRPVLNSGKRTSFRDGGDNPGQASLVEVTAQVQAGAFSKVLADMNLTDPKFIGYQTWVIHNITGELLLGPGYECVQWPQDDAFDFDTYRPNFTAQAPITVIDGLVFKGDYSDIQSYVFGDVVYFVPDGSSYVSLQYNNVAKTPGVDDEWWSLLAKRGAQGAPGLTNGSVTGPVSGVTFIDAITEEHINMIFLSGSRRLQRGQPDIGIPAMFIKIADSNVAGLIHTISVRNGEEHTSSEQT
jgi:hypothetical protein